jgi:hypothetical protein
VQGRRAEALKLIDEMKAAREPDDMLSYGIALGYVGLGDKNRAFLWLQNACAEHSDDLVDLNDDIRMDSLRSDTRFQDSCAASISRGKNLQPITPRRFR